MLRLFLFPSSESIWKSRAEHFCSNGYMVPGGTEYSFFFPAWYGRLPSGSTCAYTSRRYKEFKKFSLQLNLCNVQLTVNPKVLGEYKKSEGFVVNAQFVQKQLNKQA